MNRTSLRRIAAPSVAVLAMTTILSACGAGNEGGDSGSGGGLSGTINGAGSSAQSAAMDAWRKDFQTKNSGATVNYDPSGSGAGVESFLQKAVDFAGSDSALDPEKGEVDKAKERCGADPIEIPNYVSPIAIVFNLKDVKGLDLDAKTIAEIFAGKITKWSDPAIKATNPEAQLPDSPIRPVHRSDESGTTKNFTDYLSKASGGAWAAEADKVWPADLKGEAAAQTAGMISTVGQTDGAIGYADLSAVKDLSTVSIKVGEEFVTPTEEAAAKAMEVSKTDDTRAATDVVVKLDRNTTEAGAYPLLLVSYLIGCPSYDGDKGKLVKEFFAYVVSSEGQQSAAKNAGSAPVPTALEEKAVEIVKGMGS